MTPALFPWWMAPCPTRPLSGPPPSVTLKMVVPRLRLYNYRGIQQQQKEWRISIFLLHQAVEQTYQAILLVFTGYKPCTHNLDKLRRYTNRLSIELAWYFPGTLRKKIACSDYAAGICRCAV